MQLLYKLLLNYEHSSSIKYVYGLRYSIVIKLASLHGLAWEGLH